MNRRLSALAAVLFVLAFFLFAELASRKRSAAFAELAQRFESAVPDSASGGSTRGLIRDLLESDWGCERLAELDERRDDFAFDSARSRAYYVAPDVFSGRFGVHSVGSRLIGHCGFPRQFQLQGVRCEDDLLILELATLGDASSSDALQELWKIEGGRRYEATIDLASTRAGYATMDDIREYRLLAR